MLKTNKLPLFGDRYGLVQLIKKMVAALRMAICDMIKGNESDVENIDFELQAKRGDKFLCFTLFLSLKNCSHLCN